MTPEQHTTFIVSGLCCATEEALIRKKLRTLDGIQRMHFNVVSHKLELVHTENATSILRALDDIGLPGTIERNGTRVERKTPLAQILMTAASGLLFGLGLLLEASGVRGVLPLVCYLFSIMIGGWKVAFKGFKAIRNLSLDMNFLMTIAVAGALAIGHPAEGAAVIFLFAVSLLLESMSIDRGHRALQSLLTISPRTATIRSASGETTIPVEQVLIDSTMIIRPGERIPLDGIVTEGTSSVDQSPITGESIPITKTSGDPVFAGSLNQRGAMAAKVIKRSPDSTLAHIVHLIEVAQSKKAPSQTFIERFAAVYTPAVFFTALGLVLIPHLLFQAPFDVWLYRGLVLLVIACPCALVISTPVTVVSALTHAARTGVLIKGGRHLESLASIKAIALDKTGTLTMGAPSVTDIIAVDSLSHAEILRLAAAMETRSEHHLADAFQRKAAEENIDLNGIRIERFDSLTGKGIKADINAKTYWIGNHSLMEELGRCSRDLESILSSLEQQGKTGVILADESGALGVIGIADRLRKESTRAVASLHKEGIRPIVLLTGDNRGAAESAARDLGVDEVRFELMPAQKVEAVQELRARHGVVAMVGDGINDGPALASADVGIAMGGIGSDTALETADVVLMSDDLAKIPAAYRLGKKARSIIRENVFFALAVKALFLGLGILGMTSLWLAILADDGATLVVVFNSLRLLRRM